jgi:predicted anti-sigma-YlaC factor YlaD
MNNFINFCHFAYPLFCLLREQRGVRQLWRLVSGAVVPSLLLLTLVGVGLSGCSVQRLVVNKAGDALSGDSTIVARDDDPDLVRLAAPFSLKLMESLLAKSPRHAGLLLATTSGFTQYSYAFIQQDAEELADQDFERSEALRQRARRMYLRARDYGVRGLEARHPGIATQLRSDPAAAATATTGDDISLLYWTGVAWAAAIGQAKDDPALIGDLPIVDALIARAAQLEPGYGEGALASFQIGYEMARDARPETARANFARAVRLSQGRLASPYVSLAENVCVQQRARTEFESLLRSALAIDVDASPDHRLENLVMQRRARWLLSRMDGLFLPSPTTADQPEVKP